MIRRTILTTTAAATLAIAPLGAAVAATHPAGHAAPITRATTAATYTATTKISNRPDSGDNGNWATDNFTRTATIREVGEVAATNCPGTDTGHCYLYDATLRDTGTFTTTPGASSPRAGLNLDTAVTGTMTGGGTQIQFYDSWKTVQTRRVPATENDHDTTPTGDHTTSNWFAQFFGPTAAYQLITGGANEAWTYTAAFGTNPACPNDAYRWVDAAATGWGAETADGDVLAPDASDCT